MSSQITPHKEAKSLRWTSNLTCITSGLLLFETITGLAIYFLPFSLTMQYSVLIHTAIGVPFVVPLVWYMFKHWMDYRTYSLNHFKATGYAVMAAVLLCIVSGIVLTWEALFAYRISYLWDTIHVVSTFAIIAFVVPHVVLLLIRGVGKQKENVEVNVAMKRYTHRTLGIAGASFALVAVAVLVHQEPSFNNEFPEDYAYKHGKDRPFAPSLARTATGGAMDERTLAGSFACGTSRCHEEIAREWSVSAHRWSSMDAAFQKVQETMATQNGAESTRYCGGCHDPISLFAGTKNIFTENLTNLTGYNEGVSCLVCHAVRTTDLKGNANYVVNQLPRYAYELSEGPVAKFISDFLIRAYPRHHSQSLGKRLFKTPEYCAACHKQFIDAEVNNVGWVQLQNQYDNWRKSRWNHEDQPEKTIECRECHMPLVDSKDPASGDELDYNRRPDDGKHRSHRFLGGNQYMPALLAGTLGKKAADEQLDLTHKWLRGEVEIPEIDHKWTKGPAVPIEIVVPERVQLGEKIEVRVNITSNKVGHDFPTGPLDIIQAWIELIVTDDAGKVVYDSGTVDRKNFIKPGSFLFKAEAVDQYGNLIDRHNLWEMVGVRYRRSLFPGSVDAADYTFNCPSVMTTEAHEPFEKEEFEFQAPTNLVGKLHIKAKLRYRKIDQYLLNFLFGEETELTSTITDMSEDEAEIVIIPST